MMNSIIVKTKWIRNKNKHIQTKKKDKTEIDPNIHHIWFCLKIITETIV